MSAGLANRGSDDRERPWRGGRALNAQIAVAEGEAEAGHLTRERTEAAATLQRIRRSLSFLEKEYEDFQAFAARKNVDPAWLR